MPNFETIQAAWAEGSGFMKGSITVGYIGMVFFLIIHFALLIWNLPEFSAFRRTEACQGCAIAVLR